MAIFENKILIQDPTQAGDTGVFDLYGMCGTLILECKGSGYKFHVEGQADANDIDNWTEITGIQAEGFNTVDDITADGIYTYGVVGLTRARVYIETPGTDLIVYAAVIKD